MRRILTTVAAAAAVLLFAGTPAHAEGTVPGYTNVDGPVVIAPAKASYAVGETITLTVPAGSATAGSNLTAFVSTASNPAAYTLTIDTGKTVAADGSITAGVKIPATVPVGSYGIVVMPVDASNKIFGSPITIADVEVTTTTVAAGPATTAPTQNPTTGPLTTLPAVLAAVAAGIGGLWLRRRAA
jgi:hypothetical protein